jgi:hypothetical protein
MLVQFIHALDVLQENCLAANGASLEVIERHLFSCPIVCSQPNHVALVGDDVDQFVLSKEASNGRVALSYLVSRLNGESHMIVISKLEAQY